MRSHPRQTQMACASIITTIMDHFALHSPHFCPSLKPTHLLFLLQTKFALWFAPEYEASRHLSPRPACPAHLPSRQTNLPPSLDVTQVTSTLSEVASHFLYGLARPAGSSSFAGSFTGGSGTFGAGQ